MVIAFPIDIDVESYTIRHSVATFPKIMSLIHTNIL